MPPNNTPFPTVNTEPRGELYSQGYREGFRQAERMIANWLQYDGHGALSNAISMGKHRALPTLEGLAERPC